ncbi:MAG: AI-2E family transporter [Polyangiaceae bacterium]|nr:AI-2E family transporter [Polyangiaceae bacterium]MCW5791242.1 AI-2E family transporter [Polyangiaceae bacterium]
MSEIPSVDLPPRDPRPGWNRSRVVFLTVSAVLAVALLLATREVLLPFIVAIILAYVLTPLVAYAERARIPRALAIILVYLLVFASLYGFGALIFPRVVDEAVQLTRETPVMAKNLAEKWGPVAERRVQEVLDRLESGAKPTASPEVAPDGTPDVPQPPKPAFEVTPREGGGFDIALRGGVDIVQEGPKRWRVQPPPEPGTRFSVQQLLNQGVDQTVEYIKRNALELVRVGQVIISQVSRGIFLLFMTLMIAAYLIMTREDIIGFFRSLPPPRARRSFDRLLARMDRGLAGVVRGQLMICLVNGVLSAIGFWIFDLKYWPILALIAGVMSLIPIFGSILSTIPAVLVGLTQDFWTALWVLVWIIGIHQIEANLLNPKIIGVAAKIHPVLVVLALIIGEHFFGLWGALFAVPALSLVQSLFQHFRFESLPDAAPDSLFPSAGQRPSVVPEES